MKTISLDCVNDDMTVRMGLGQEEEINFYFVSF